MATRKAAQIELKQRIYTLVGGITPVNFILRSRHTSNKPLQYFDGKLNRSLRYASNQSSIFEDEQVGDVTLPAIVFNDGKLVTRPEDTILQEFLSKHPDNGKLFVEFDPAGKAEIELETIEREIEAMTLARSMEIEDLEAVARVVLKSKVNDMSSKEIKRDMLLFAKSKPETFLNLANDENIKLRNLAIRAVEMGVLRVAPDNATVTWAKGKKEKVVTVPFGENVYSGLAKFFKTDEGIEVMQAIVNEL
jgi:hypothetical protein